MPIAIEVAWLDTDTSTGRAVELINDCTWPPRTSASRYRPGRMRSCLPICSVLCGCYAASDRVTVLLDAGYYLPLRAAESIPAQLSERVGAQLTQYGNVGPLTVAHLAEATITAARLANIR